MEFSLARHTMFYKQWLSRFIIQLWGVKTLNTKGLLAAMLLLHSTTLLIHALQIMEHIYKCKLCNFNSLHCQTGLTVHFMYTFYQCVPLELNPDNNQISAVPWQPVAGQSGPPLPPAYDWRAGQIRTTRQTEKTRENMQLNELFWQSTQKLYWVNKGRWQNEVNHIWRTKWLGDKKLNH